MPGGIGRRKSGAPIAFGGSCSHREVPGTEPSQGRLSSGMAEPLAAFVGALFVNLFQSFLPFSLAFAGGAMLYVVSDELIPESHSHGYEHQATFGFISGFVLFMALVKLIE